MAENDMQIKSIFPPGHKNYPNIIKPVYKRFLYEKAYKCPACNRDFNDYKIFYSKLFEEKPQRYDLRKFYRDFQTEWYDIVVCPGCYFSAFSSLFGERQKLYKMQIYKKLQAIRKILILDFSNERDINFVFASHYLALISALAFSKSLQIQAKVWGSISWLYEDVQDKEMEKFAAKNAAEAHIKIYNEVTITPQLEQMAALSAAGMLYRADEKADIKQWIFHVKTNPAGKKLYANLADDIAELLCQEAQTEGQ